MAVNVLGNFAKKHNYENVFDFVMILMVFMVPFLFGFKEKINRFSFLR